MKSVFFLMVITCLGVIGLSACGGEMGNSVANTSRAAANTAEKIANSAGNTANSVANAVSGVTTAGPESFMKDAAQGNMAEIEMGKLAEQKSKNPEIKKFGQMMVTDHTAAGTDMKALAAKKNVTLPTDTGSHKSMIDSLSKETDGFDKAYVNGMVSGHEDMLKMFQKQADSSSDADVKAFAVKLVPTIQKHLDAIKGIQAKMK